MLRVLTSWLPFALLLCGLAISVSAQAPTQTRGVVKIAKVVGEVSVTDVASTLKTRVAANSLVTDGQIVETGPNASVVLVFSNGAVVNVKANSRLEVDQFLQNPFGENFKVREAMHEPSTSTTKLFLRKGEIVSQVKKLNREAGSSFTVATPVGAAGIRGTAFKLSFTPVRNLGQFTLAMAEGLIRFLPASGRSVDVGAGKQLSFTAELDASTGAVRSVPEMPEPGNVSSEDQASLQQGLTEALGAAISVEFSGTPGAPMGQFSTGSTAPQTATPSATTGTSTNGSTDSALAAPPPTPATQRTTPGDGE